MEKIEVMGIEIELQEEIRDDLEDTAWREEGETLVEYLEKKVASKWLVFAHEGANSTFSMKDVLEISCIQLAGE
jgi:hypothetical protein